MGLLAFFQRDKQAAARQAKGGKAGRGARPAARQAPAATANPAETADAVREARARARRRLMGATVLLLVGVIGFPLLFETQPRPIPVDLPIDIPSRNGAAAVDAPAHGGGPSAASRAAALAAVSVPSGPTPESVSYDDRAGSASAAKPAAASEPARKSAFATLASAFTSSPQRANEPAAMPAPVAVATPAVAPPPAAPSRATVAPKPAPTPTPKPAVAATPAPHVTPPPPALPPATTAAAAPNPPEAASTAARYVVQIGAFADDAKARDARGKVEKLGMKTYTQSVDTPAGKRVRVRVGPYATKADADKAASRIKGDGLPAAVLVL